MFTVISISTVFAICPQSVQVAFLLINSLKAFFPALGTDFPLTLITKETKLTVSHDSLLDRLLWSGVIRCCEHLVTPFYFSPSHQINLFLSSKLIV